MNRITVGKNFSEEVYLDSKDSKYFIEVEENASIKVYHYAVDKSFDVEIHLKGENASVEYFYSTLNKKDNYFKIKVFHDFSNTKSNLVNHGVNILDKKLNFVVDGIIPKDVVGCVCSQDNKIMNLCEGKSSIAPNLLIDSHDNIANHSAYIGNFKEDVLFYLKSRGISQKIATKMLTLGFLVHDLENEEEIKDFLKYIDELS